MVSINVKFIIILITIVLMVILLSRIELYINERKSMISVSVLKNSCVLLPSYTGLKDPVYIYNSNKVKKKDLRYEGGYVKSEYVKKDIHEHVASKIFTPLNDLGKLLKSIPKSKMPLNSIYLTLSKSGEIINTADPLSYNSLSGYRLLTSKRDNVEAFIAHNKIYINK